VRFASSQTESCVSLCVDVAVTDPLQVKFVDGAARSSSFAANEYAKVKLAKYSDLISRKSDSLEKFENNQQ
jgi:hypothetical protein